MRFERYPLNRFFACAFGSGHLCRGGARGVGRLAFLTTPDDHVYRGVYDGHAGVLGSLPGFSCCSLGIHGADDHVAPPKLERSSPSL